MTAEMAAIPEENAAAREPPSRSARALSAASVSIDRFRFNFVPSFASDEIHDVAPFPLRRFLLLPGEVGERPPVQNRFDGFGRLLDQPRHRGGGLLVAPVPRPLPAGGRGHPAVAAAGGG